MLQETELPPAATPPSLSPLPPRHSEVGKDPLCFGCKGWQPRHGHPFWPQHKAVTLNIQWLIFSPEGFALHGSLLMQAAAKEEMTGAWHSPLPSAAPSSFQCFLFWSATIRYFLSLYLQRVHVETSSLTQHYSFLSKSHSDITSSSISLYAFFELGIPLSAASTQRPVGNQDWQHLCNKTLFLSSNLFRPLKPKSLFQSWLLSWLSPCSHQTADEKGVPGNIFSFLQT